MREGAEVQAGQPSQARVGEASVGEARVDAPTAPIEVPPGASVEIDLTDEAVADHGGRLTIDLGLATTVARQPSGSSMVGRPQGVVAAALAASPLALFVLVNALNMLDAALTVVWIEMGVAIEGNPVVDAIGFPAKVVLVAAGSWLVARWRPRALLVPILVLGGVNAYHVLGAAWFVLRPLLV